MNRNAAHALDFSHTLDFYIWAGFIVLLPFSFAHDLSSIIYRCLIFTMAANWLLGKKYLQIRALRNNYPFLLFAFFYFLHIVGLSYTANLGTGLFQLEKNAMFLVLPFVMATSRKFNKRELHVLFKLFMASVMLACFICLGYAFYRNSKPNIEGINWLFFAYWDFTDIISIQPDYLAVYVSFSILILLWMAIENRNRYGRNKLAFVILTILIFIGFLGLLSARMPILALFIILCTTFLIYFYKEKKTITGLLVIAAFSSLFVLTMTQIPIVKERFYALLGMTEKLEWVTRYGDGTQLQDVRLRKWNCALNIISNHPIFGVGTGDVQDELQKQYKKTNFRVALEAKFNAHNQFLQTFIALGVVGLLSLLACLLVPAAIAIKQKQFLYVAFVSLFSLCCLTESMFERQFGIVFFGLFNSLFLFNGLDTNRHKTTSTDTAKHLSSH